MEQIPLLRTIACSIGYGGKKKRAVASGLDTELYAGQLICLLGPNGCGKSTFLRTMAGLQPLITGKVEIKGENISNLSATEMARRVSLVLTDSVRSSNMDVYSLVALGRYPYSRWMSVLSDKDKEIIDWSVKATGIEKLLGRKVDVLSDGESQKVMLARALAQDTALIFLDEPTAHLDLPSRIQLMKLLHGLVQKTDKAIVVSTHELDLALQVADVVWLVTAEGILHKGSPEDLVLNGTFERVFDDKGVIFDKETGAFNINQNPEKTIGLQGEGNVKFWTKKALLRAGYAVDSSDKSADVISVNEAEKGTKWNLILKGKQSEHLSIASLVQTLKETQL